MKYEINKIRDCGQGYSFAAYRDEANEMAQAGRTLSEISETLSVAPNVVSELLFFANSPAVNRFTLSVNIKDHQ